MTDIIHPDDRNELERLTRVIEDAKSEAGRNLWLIGASLIHIRDQRLWTAGSYANFTDYAESGAQVSRSYGYDLMAIAAQFNEAVSERYGIDKLDAAVRYLRATPGSERPGDLLAADIKLKGDDGRFLSKPLHEASTHEIRQATTLVQQAKAARNKPGPEFLDAADRVASQLPAVKGVSAKTRVQVKKAKDGRVVVTFRDIPIDQLEAFVEVVGEEWLGRE